jgi:hypothetical protein
MYTKIWLDKFKPFASRQTGKLAPLTFIYGPNSAGKSSIIQSILLLKQSSYSSTSMYRTAGPINPSGPEFNFGSIRALVHRQRPGQAFTIGLEYELPHEENPFFGPNTSSYGSESPVRAGVEIKVRVPHASDPNEHWIEELTYSFIGEMGTEGILEFRQGLRRTKDETGPNDVDEPTLIPTGSYSLKEASIGLFIDILGNTDPELVFSSADEENVVNVEEAIERAFKVGEFTDSSPIGNYELFPISFNIDQKASRWRQLHPKTLYMGQPYQFWQELNRAVTRNLGLDLHRFEECLNSVVHLGPLRSPEQRGLRFHYQDTAETVGSDGGNASGVFTQSTPDQQERINLWLKRLKLNYEVRVENRSDLIIGNLLQLTLKTRGNDPVIRTSSDVGFGFTQIMPVIVQGVVSRSDVICVEQPEIHLHPRLQAELTDFFIDTAEKNDNQWVIETHSELLVRRLQRRIREGSLDPEQVSILYVDPISAQSSRIIELRLNEDGEFIDEWPEGFFDEGFNEATAPNSRPAEFLEGEILDIPSEEDESLGSSR